MSKLSALEILKALGGTSEYSLILEYVRKNDPEWTPENSSIEWELRTLRKEKKVKRCYGNVWSIV
jgi:hypothetical protein